MNEANTKALLEAGPALYRDGMYFECDDGWFQPLLALTKALESRMLLSPGCPIEAVCQTVKQKFGGLRVYMSSETDEMSAAIDMAERWCSVTCEACGKPGKPTTVNRDKTGTRQWHWMTVRCGECEEVGT